MKRGIAITILIIFVFGLILPNKLVFAREYEKLIRIKLTLPYGSTDEIHLYSDCGFSIYSEDNLDREIKFLRDKRIVISTGGNNQIYILDLDDNEVFTYDQRENYIITSNHRHDNRVKIGNNYYRDYVSFKISGGHLVAINYIYIDNYLYGVLPREMPTSFELEALKAQAIAARTYTLKNINKHSNENYDLCDTTHCQVYGGMDCEQDVSNRAVDETRGMIITYNNDIIDALYHSNSGGVTASSFEAFGHSSIPYLSTVEDRFSEDSPNSNWTLHLTSGEINNRLKNNNINIGDIMDIVIEDISPSGRVTKVKLIGSRGDCTLANNQIREIFGTTELKSTWFTINKGSEGEYARNKLYAIDGNSTRLHLVDMDTAYVVNDNLKITSNRGFTSRFINKDRTIEESKQRETVPDGFTIEGKGYGHGVGMSQWGAQRMAELGYSSDEILKHYYNGIDIVIFD